jgi:hypothetical protein
VKTLEADTHRQIGDTFIKTTRIFRARNSQEVGDTSQDSKKSIWRIRIGCTTELNVNEILRKFILPATFPSCLSVSTPAYKESIPSRLSGIFR